MPHHWSVVEKSQVLLMSGSKIHHWKTWSPSAAWKVCSPYCSIRSGSVFKCCIPHPIKMLHRLIWAANHTSALPPYTALWDAILTSSVLKPIYMHLMATHTHISGYLERLHTPATRTDLQLCRYLKFHIYRRATRGHSSMFCLSQAPILCHILW